MRFQFENVSSVTKTLININLLVYLATIINKPFMMRAFALYYVGSPFFSPIQIVTHLFMHGGLMHLLFNMLALYSIGSLLERTIGQKKFLILYFVCGLGAVALHQGVEALQIGLFGQRYLMNIPTVGASGAIYGLLVAYAMLFPDATVSLIFPPIPMRAKTFVLVFIVLEMFSGISGFADGVAHFAHLGGILFGWLLINYWRKAGTLFDDYGRY